MSFRLMPSPSSSFPFPHLDHKRQKGIGRPVYPCPYPCLAAGEEGGQERRDSAISQDSLLRKGPQRWIPVVPMQHATEER